MSKETLKRKLELVKEERAERARMREQGKAKMTILVDALVCEKAVSKAGNPYERVVCQFRTLRGESKDRKAPIYTPEAEFIIENLEPQKRYEVAMEKDENGYWRWVSAEEINDEPLA